jgi:Rps23 Pro-64 3,4-dihydroxylase Tpa1-like proline 4-hydroxylase
MDLIPAFYFDPESLSPVADRERDSFRNAPPFEHVVLDDLLPADVVDLLVREFPGPDDPAWQMHGPGRTVWARDRSSAKLAISDETRFGPFTRHLMGQLNSATFLAFLERLTGYRGIIPDVSYNHCGMHSTGRGGRLMMHTDVNRHPLGSQMHQLLNLILYVNPDWKEEYGGHLELWDHERRPVKRILPRSNRIVIFNTGTRSLHGHPHPLTCPEGRRRNSLAVYYYLRERPQTDGYEGQQKTVRWFPATEDDRTFATERREKALAELGQLRGSTLSVPPDIIPFDVPAGFVDPRNGCVPLYVLRPEDVADAQGFAKRHLASVIAQHGSTPERFLTDYRPVALLGPRDGAAITCLLDGAGEMYVARGPAALDLFWVGYLDEVLASLPR